MNDSTPVPGQKNKVEFSADYFSRLSDVEFEYSCREECFLVLEFALHRMTDEQFDFCCRRSPWAGLLYGCERITIDLLNVCLQDRDCTRFLSHDGIQKLGHEQFDYCCKEIPWEVLFNAPDCLSPEQVTQCVSGCKTELLEDFRVGRVPPELLQVLFQQVAHLDAEVAAAVWEAISREI